MLRNARSPRGLGPRAASDLKTTWIATGGLALGALLVHGVDKAAFLELLDEGQIDKLL